jgi:hypothetical protein
MAHYICQNPDCSKPFTSTNRNPKTCSPACKYKMMRTTVAVTCDNPNCGVTFQIRPRALKFAHHYCSEACQHYKTEEQRFWEKVTKDICAGDLCGCRYGLDHCWLWTGADNGKGYGHFIDDADQQWLPHRYVYTRYVGPIPEGLFTLHRCDNRRCVNYIEHLFLGTNTDNMQDASQKGRTHWGERTPTAKLTESDVYEIRALQGKQSAEETGREFGVNGMQIGRIWRRERWAHLPEK